MQRDEKKEKNRLNNITWRQRIKDNGYVRVTVIVKEIYVDQVREYVNKLNEAS